MGLFRRNRPQPTGGTVTIGADTKGIRRARTRLADLRQALAWHRAQPASAKRKRKLEQLEDAIRGYESALDAVRASLTEES